MRNEGGIEPESLEVGDGTERWEGADSALSSTFAARLSIKSQGPDVFRLRHSERAETDRKLLF